ncbi:hypothetical protein TNCV_448421 [Trichonephila clavipes]|nr:hypothetical protein TNCV_448421 [Trichonephila clavipes]
MRGVLVRGYGCTMVMRSMGWDISFFFAFRLVGIVGKDVYIFSGCVIVRSNIGDEAHFWLNGYVNKQNCRIWSEANLQVYVETPLHPEKLTVWCTLWAGGILLQKR